MSLYQLFNVMKTLTILCLLGLFLALTQAMDLSLSDDCNDGTMCKAGCCIYPKAVCCPSGNACCPHGTSCDEPHQECKSVI
ncbi:hypothetical protein L596_010328 [Steinernema carpocapsae]|uniref:Granulins domain-containing protein n=1 Tax=Steinernema carpocapsae TaxID=34508 RepID=A0A4U5PIG8_STECR|nr:hypothetical protein L596_010328 [Steinernema carpocapsae]